jgi:hypothetical protein
VTRAKIRDEAAALVEAHLDASRKMPARREG